MQIKSWLAAFQESRERGLGSVSIQYTEKSGSVSRSVISDTSQPHGLQPARLPCRWNSPGKNTGVGSHPLLQAIFPTQGSNPVSCIADRVFTVWTTREVFHLCPTFLNKDPSWFDFSKSSLLFLPGSTGWGWESRSLSTVSIPFAHAFWGS